MRSNGAAPVDGPGFSLRTSRCRRTAHPRPARRPRSCRAQSNRRAISSRRRSRASRTPTSPTPRRRGLTLLCAAWEQADTAERTLEVFKDRAAAGARVLGAQRFTAAPGIDFRGLVGIDQFRARLRGAHAFISAARWEDCGQAPLEALSDGALLVTAPAQGPYEALAIARELDAQLVASSSEPAALARAARRRLRTRRRCGWRLPSRPPQAPGALPLGLAPTKPCAHVCCRRC